MFVSGNYFAGGWYLETFANLFAHGLAYDYYCAGRDLRKSLSLVAAFVEIRKPWLLRHFSYGVEYLST